MKNQCQLVLDHMIDHGYITPLIAQSYGIQRLAARIKDLKAQGCRIDAVVKCNDAGQRYAKYSLSFRLNEQVRRDLRGLGWRSLKTYTGGRPCPVAA